MQLESRSTRAAQPVPSGVPSGITAKPDLPASLNLISIRDTAKRTSLSRASLWSMARAGRFPAMVELGPRRKAFLLNEVDAWVAARVAARDEGRAA